MDRTTDTQNDPGERPSVSVVVPYFNSADYLEACLEGLAGQQGVEGTYEVILINNGSQDGAPEIAAGHPEFLNLEEATPGAYAARNTGIRAARAPIIALTDADCVAAPNWLSTIQGRMRDPQVGALIGRCHYPKSASRWLHLLGAYENAKAEYTLERLSPAHHFAYANNMAVRRAVFDELGPFLEWKRAGDSELVHRMAAERPGLRVEYVPQMEVTHLEFLRGADRARRLSLYTETNAKIETFRELGFGQRLGVLWHLLLGGGRAS